jgi:hypothetical protein
MDPINIDLDPIISACRVLGDFISGFFDDKISDLSDFFSDQEFMLHLLKICLYLIQSRDIIEARRVGSYLVARIFSLHFGEFASLNLESFLETEIYNNGQNQILGTFYYRELVDILIENYDPLDFSFMESVRLSLQCLLGRCEFAKKDAIECKFLFALTLVGLGNLLFERAQRILDSGIGNKLDDSSQISLFVIVTLYRHLFAGYEYVKVSLWCFIENRWNVITSLVYSMTSYVSEALVNLFGSRLCAVYEIL